MEKMKNGNCLQEHHLKIGLKRLGSLRVERVAGIYLFMQIYFWINIHGQRGFYQFDIRSCHDCIWLLWSIITLIFFVHAINAPFKAYKTKVVINLFFLFFFGLILAYHRESKEWLDLTLVFDNFGEAFSDEAFKVILGSLHRNYLARIGGLLILVIILEAAFGTFVRRSSTNYNVTQKIIFPIVYVVILLSPLPAYDEITFSLKSAISQAMSYSSHDLNVPDQEYPFVHSVINRKGIEAQDKNKPHIILLFIESLNSKILGRRHESGLEYTPNLNRLTGNSFYVEKFYGNSIQTCKGHFATLFSLIPSIKGKVYKRYKGTNFHSLASILANNGYLSILIRAHDNMDFDNTRDFLGRNGYSILESTKEYLRESDRENMLPWGPDDKTFYTRAFEMIDHYHTTSQKNLFITLVPVGTHPYFNIPDQKRKFFKKAGNIFEHYANAISLTDEHLTTFFEEIRNREYLRNSLIVMVGDHSYPLGDHGIRRNESGFYDESYRTFFCMLWDNHLGYEKITRVAYSQMDIAPTILEAIGIDEYQSHFLGTSMLEGSDEQHPIFLIQPYSGVYLSVLQYPYKFTRHRQTGREFFFNLEADPEENHNLISALSESDREKYLESLECIFLNQALIEDNRIWPKEMPP